MDVLSDVIQTSRLQSAPLGRVAMRAPWALAMPQLPHSVFHVVLEGSCWLSVKGDSPRQAHKGDVLLMPAGDAHVFRDAPDSLATPRRFDPALAASLSPGANGDADTHLLCGTFRFDDRATNLILSALPSVLHVHELSRGIRPWILHTLELLDLESRTPAAGADAALVGLCDALFIYILRDYLANAAAGDAGWLRAVVDPQIGEALRLIHADPGASWTVPKLATRVAMSRSAFAARFTELVGRTPLQYVIDWRLRKAASLLRAQRQTIAEIAQTVGYESEAAFNKAFKRGFGTTPGAYRGGASISADVPAPALVPA